MACTCIERPGLVVNGETSTDRWLPRAGGLTDASSAAVELGRPMPCRGCHLNLRPAVMRRLPQGESCSLGGPSAQMESEESRDGGVVDSGLAHLLHAVAR